MVRLSQGCTPTGERLALLGCGGSKKQCFVTLTVVGIEQQKGPSNGVLMVEHFILLPKQYLFFFFEWNYHGNNILSVYMSKKTHRLKKLKLPSLGIKGHV
jgi:hypothetical protein